MRTQRKFSLRLVNVDDAPRAVALLEKQTGVHNIETAVGSIQITLDATEKEIAAILEHLVREGVPFTEFREEMVDLETAFMTLTKGELA